MSADIDYSTAYLALYKRRSDGSVVKFQWVSKEYGDEHNIGQRVKELNDGTGVNVVELVTDATLRGVCALTHRVSPLEDLLQHMRDLCREIEGHSDDLNAVASSITRALEKEGGCDGR